MSLPETLRAMVSTMVGEDNPRLAYVGKWTYRVDKVTVTQGVRCNLSPVEGNPHQGLDKVDQWPGVGGSVTVPVVGSECVVEFRDGLKDRPVIVGFKPRRLDGGKPTVATIDGVTVDVGPTADHVRLAVGPDTIQEKAVARVGDAVAGGSFTATGVAPGSPILFTFYPPGESPPGPTPAPGVVCTISGIITSGSAKVTSG